MSNVVNGQFPITEKPKNPENIDHNAIDQREYGDNVILMPGTESNSSTLQNDITKIVDDIIMNTIKDFKTAQYKYAKYTESYLLGFTVTAKDEMLMYAEGMEDTYKYINTPSSEALLSLDINPLIKELLGMYKETIWTYLESQNGDNQQKNTLKDPQEDIIIPQDVTLLIHRIIDDGISDFIEFKKTDPIFNHIHLRKHTPLVLKKMILKTRGIISMLEKIKEASGGIIEIDNSYIFEVIKESLGEYKEKIFDLLRSIYQ